MENANGIFWEVSIWTFLLVTVALAGGAAFLTGRAQARAWQGPKLLVFYIVLLTAATRFMHFALFGGTLLSLHYYLVDFVVLTAIAFAGKRMTRSKQMGGQYSFAYDRKGSFSWARKG